MSRTIADKKALQRYKGKKMGMINGISYDTQDTRRFDFAEGYLEAEKDLIEKAIRWIECNANNGGVIYDGWKEDFRKEMVENEEL